MTLVETSPGFEVTDPRWTPHSPHEAPPCGGALSLFNMGDMRRYYVKCPECGDWFMVNPGPEGLEFNHDHDDFGVTKTKMTRDARLVCTANGCLIEEKHKKKMNAEGLWLAEGDEIVDNKVIKKKSRIRIASFWFPGAFATYSSWSGLAQKYLNGMREYDVTGIEENLKTCINVDFSCPYLRMRLANNVSATDYMERAEVIERGVVHSGVRFLTGSVDVQAWGFSVMILGYGINLECWVIDRFEIRLSDRRDEDDQPCVVNPASYLEDWLLLIGHVIEKRYPLSDGSGRTMGVTITGCDSGGRQGVTHNAYLFWKTIRKKGLQSRFKLLKGERPKPEASNPPVRLTTLDKTSEAARKAKVVGRLDLWILNTTMLKDSISGCLQRTEVGTDYIHFPDWLKLNFYEELTAENRTESGWSNPSRAKNEAFDLLCYCKAVFLIKMKDHWDSEINWGQPPAWAKEWNDNELVYTVDGKVDEKNIKSKIKRRVRMRSRQ